MAIKNTKIRCLELMAFLTAGIKNLEDSGVKISKNFSFMVNYNIEKLTPAFNSIQETTKSTIPEYLKYKEEKNKLFDLYSIKNDDGKSLRVQNNVVVPKDKKDELDCRLNDLTLRYGGAIKARKEEEKEIEELLNDEIELDLIKINFKYIPDIINPTDLKILKPIIIESDEEITKLIS